MSETMRQEAPYPQELAGLVAQLAYRPGWEFRLADTDRGQGSRGLTLVVTTCGYNAYHPDRGEGYRVHHYMLVPPAAYDRRSWENWLFEQLLLVEKHECMEFFRFEWDEPNRTGTEVLGANRRVLRPKAPAHGEGNDPYLVLTYGTDIDRRTSFRGELNPE